MDENLTTDTTIVESTVTHTDTAVTNTDIADGSQVIETSTPMDNNVTYDNIDISNNVTDPTVTNPTEPTNDIIIDPNKPLVDNVYDNIITQEHDTNLINSNGSAMENFFLKDYDYDVDEVGSYWVGGAMNDVKNQMSFLNVLINEEMYDALDLQKYYFDNNLATARAYAAKKDKETAYNYYRAAQEKAIAEGQLTGWYMPAEGKYMLGQYTIAMNILENPDASQEEKDKAQRIADTVGKWFDANKISTKGIKCLGMMNYEETVRHNKVTEKLQDQANKAAASSAGAQLAATLWDIAELELVWRTDLDNNGVIGHTAAERKATNSDLFHYLNEHEAWQGMYKWSETITDAWRDGSARTMANIAGVNYDEINKKYNYAVQQSAIDKDLLNKQYVNMSSLEASNYKVVGSEKITVMEPKDGSYRKAGEISGSDIKNIYPVYKEMNGTMVVSWQAETKDGAVFTIRYGDTKVYLPGSDNSTIKLSDVFANDDSPIKFYAGDLKDSSGKVIQFGNKRVTNNVANTINQTTYTLPFVKDSQIKNVQTMENQGGSVIPGVISLNDKNGGLVCGVPQFDENGNYTGDKQYSTTGKKPSEITDPGNDTLKVTLPRTGDKLIINEGEWVYGNGEKPSWWNKYINGTVIGWSFDETVGHYSEYVGNFTPDAKTGVQQSGKALIWINPDGSIAYLTYDTQGGNPIYRSMTESEVNSIKWNQNYKDETDLNKKIQANYFKQSTTIPDETGASVVEDANEKNTKKTISSAVGAGVAAIQHILNPSTANGSDDTNFKEHNTTMEDKPNTEGTDVDLGEVDFTADNNNINDENSDEKEKNKGGKE